ncbi:MAG: hypothetical protein KatS3mg008_0469 [Acidimicrobiales bacterium]|nr:MAG: hypothetical protein KatS3mg008_0469 [Acidimicrobiales bacterium]
MIYIVTVHYRQARWIGPQRRYLDRNVSEPYRLWASMPGVDERHRRLVDRCVVADGTHAGQLNHLAALVCEVAEPEDWLWFLDGDAFPVSDPVPYVRQALETHDLVAIRRDENDGERQPHPSFCATTVRTWIDIRGDWSDGHCWQNAAGEWVTDVGGNLLWLLRDRSWKPILRSNHTNLHPVWFGVYGGVIYHHGAGFRPDAVTREDYARLRRRTLGLESSSIRLLRSAAKRVRQRFEEDVIRKKAELDVQMYERLSVDPDFWRVLSHGPEESWNRDEVSA